MAAEYRISEPFPHFVDSNGPWNSNYFSSNMTLFHLLNTKKPSSPRFEFRLTIPAKISDYLRLKYYQYEVTYGLYVMTFEEKLIVNTFVFCVLTTIFYGVFFGLQPFLVRSLCRFVWYTNGSLDGVQDLCTEGMISGGCTS